MTVKTITEIVSDLSAESGAKTYSFAWSGMGYEVDLTDSEYTEFAKVMTPYIQAGRKKSNGTRRQSRSTPNGATAHDVRKWAKKTGVKLSTRGRIPANVMQQYLDSSTTH